MIGDFTYKYEGITLRLTTYAFIKSANNKEPIKIKALWDTNALKSPQ